MIKALFLAFGVATIFGASGCVFSKKAHRAKETSAISADVEESFRRRWVDKRVGELTAQGSTADIARTQAENEFRQRYSFTRAGQK